MSRAYFIYDATSQPQHRDSLLFRFSILLTVVSRRGASKVRLQARNGRFSCLSCMSLFEPACMITSTKHDIAAYQQRQMTRLRPCFLGPFGAIGRTNTSPHLIEKRSERSGAGECLGRAGCHIARQQMPRHCCYSGKMVESKLLVVSHERFSNARHSHHLKRQTKLPPCKLARFSIFWDSVS